MTEYEEVAVRNTIAAQKYADATIDAEQAQREILDSAKNQTALSNWRRELYENERAERRWDGWYYKGIIGLILIGIAL